MLTARSNAPRDVQHGVDKDDLQSDSLVLRTHLVAGSQPLEDLLTRVAELVRSRLHRRGPPRLQSASRVGPQTRFSCMWRTTLPGLVAGLRPERGSVSANAGALRPERSVRRRGIPERWRMVALTSRASPGSRLNLRSPRPTFACGDHGYHCRVACFARTVEHRRQTTNKGCLMTASHPAPPNLPR